MHNIYMCIYIFICMYRNEIHNITECYCNLYVLNEMRSI